MSASSSGLERLHAAMAAHVERHELPGLVTLVAQDDDVHVDAIGTKAVDSDEPLRRETLFRIASMTKPILAVATLLLMEDGKLELDDHVERWLPELSNRRVLRHIDGPLGDSVPARRPITVDDLLTFRMGFGMVTEPSMDPPFPIVLTAKELQLVLNQPDPRTPHAPDAWMQRFGSLPLMYQPGERWQYNVGSLVLGVLVARVAGQPLPDFFRTRIFEPLGMRTTGFSLPLEITRDLPAYYITNFESGRLERRDVSTPEEWSRPPIFPSGAAGLISTADDYLTFARCLLNGGEYRGQRVLSAESVELMTTNHLTPEQMATGGMILGGVGWGFGVSVVTEPGDAWPVQGRYGWAGGYGTDWFNDPHRGIVAILLSQTSDVMWNGMLGEFDQLVAGCFT
ncbi:MAG: beta-lactamase family protein [Chloroflexi bacterium]|nr:beta-lactamase family protein [Chloroflexota bacterium]